MLYLQKYEIISALQKNELSAEFGLNLFYEAKAGIIYCISLLLR